MLTPRYVPCIDKVLTRDPSERELAIADKYLAIGTMKDFAHALLLTNEVIFWP